jgi:Predicted flavoprotein involved in K+ transport
MANDAGQLNGHSVSNGTGQTQSSLTKPSWVPVLEQPVYRPRKLRVVCIGAGFSGLTLAYEWKHHLQMEDYIDLMIYEKNADVGGTWFENRYPGIACDVGYTFYIAYMKGCVGADEKHDRFPHTSIHSPSNQIQTGPLSTPAERRFSST